MKALTTILLALLVLGGCVSYNSDDPTKWNKQWEVASDFRICQMTYPSYDSNTFGSLRSVEYRKVAFQSILKEMDRRGLNCSEKYPSFEEFKGKTQLELLLESQDN